MKVAYLLESTVLCGGVKVVFRQAEALLKRHHHVVVICPEERPPWFDGHVLYERNDPLDRNLLKGYDRIIATTPRLIWSLYRHPEVRKKLWHLVQGYEGDCQETQGFKVLIEDAYSLPVRKITVSKCLADRLGRTFPGRLFFSVGQGLERHYFFPGRDGQRQPTAKVCSIFLVGPLTISVKQIRLGLIAFSKAREYHPFLKLVRIATVDTRSEEEPMVARIKDYHVHLSPREVGEVFRSGNGILLSPSGPGEGFGLPALEAMASGLPTVLSDIPSHRGFSDPCDYAMFVSHDDANAMAMALCQLIEDVYERQRLIKKGLEVAALFSFDKVAEALEGVLSIESRG